MGMRSEAKHNGKIERTKIVWKKILGHHFAIVVILIFICMPSLTAGQKEFESQSQ
jgi:hypothetical protein